ncbi:MAG: alpha/beta fold hydrolase [Actinomycetota bacterium]
MAHVMSDGVRLAVDVIGDGEPVTVVGHGLTGSRADFAPLAAFLPGTKVLFDFRGHGESERPPAGSYSMDAFAADVDAVAEAHGATGLVGVSLGGGATLRLLHSKPDRFERLVFILPARLERSDEARTRLLRLADLLEAHPPAEVATILVAEEESQGLFDGFPGARDIRTRSILGMNGEGIPFAIREAVDDPPVRDPQAIRVIAAPALVIGQEGDPVHDARVARDLAEALPNAKLLLYPDRFALLRDVGPLTLRVASFLTGVPERT